MMKSLNTNTLSQGKIMTEAVNETQEEAATEVKPTKEEKAAAKAALKAQKDAEKAALKAAKDAEKEAKKAEPKPEKAKDVKNGVSRPASGVTKMVWDKADELSKSAGQCVERAVLTAALDGIVETGTIHTQYGRWRKYWGMSETKEARRARLEGVREKNKALREEAAAKKKAEKEAAKAEKDRKAAEKKAAKEAAEAEKAAKQAELPVDGQSEADQAAAEAAE